MDKRNRPALAYLLVGVASAGRAMLAMPDAVALQEVSLTVLALVGYLLLGRRALPVLACGTVQLVLELVLCGTLAGPAWLAPLLRAAALWLLWATVTQMLKIAGYTTGKRQDAGCGCRAAGRILRCTLFCRGGHRGVLCLHRVQHHPAVVRRAAAARLQHHPREKVSPRLVKTGIVCYTI